MHNPELYESLPTIIIINTNASVVTTAVAKININGESFDLKCTGGYDYAILDGETMQYIAHKSDGTTNFVDDTIPPKFKVGDNQIVVTAYKNALLSIKPNWRRL